jgi:hypothetical protein
MKLRSDDEYGRICVVEPVVLAVGPFKNQSPPVCAGGLDSHSPSIDKTGVADSEIPVHPRNLKSAHTSDRAEVFRAGLAAHLVDLGFE